MENKQKFSNFNRIYNLFTPTQFELIEEPWSLACLLNVLHNIINFSGYESSCKISTRVSAEWP